MVTGLKLYNNMICTSIRTSQDKDTANVLVFEAELREVLIVVTKTVKYKPKPGATNRQVASKKDKGEQQGKEVSDQKQKASLLSKIGKAVKGG